MESSGRQCCVVVLGAGRSGTSAVTRALEAIGVELGNDLRPGGRKNPTGFFEDQGLLALNKKLKTALRIRGDSVRLIDDSEWRSAAVQAVRREAVELMQRRFGSFSVWGYKYGRTLRLLPVWLEVYRDLDLDVRWCVALRNPLSVARSRGKLDPRRGTQEKSDLEWLVNVVPYFRRVRGRPLTVVDYDRVMADPVRQLERMAAQLHLAVSGDVRRGIEDYAGTYLLPGMRHSRFGAADLENDPTVNELVRDAYRWLDRLAADEIDVENRELWTDWERLERRVAALAPVLRHVDRVEEDLRRAQRHPMGPLQMAPQLWRKLRGG